LSDKTRLSRIEISKQAFSFSIGHFTIFSATERENLHGHNFQLHCHVTAPLEENGMLFDYAIIKTLIRSLCDEIDEHVILPSRSPYLTLNEEGDYVTAEFDGETMYFLKRDVMVLPVTNTTIEEFSHHFLNKLVDHPDLQNRGITDISVRVSSSPGQYGVADWSKA